MLAGSLWYLKSLKENVLTAVLKISNFTQTFLHNQRKTLENVKVKMNPSSNSAELPVVFEKEDHRLLGQKNM